jgi:dCMP deaminase
MKTKMISFYMDICDRIAALSVAKRLQVGSLIVKNNNILAFGWNGTPAGWDNCCEEWNGEDDWGNTILKTKPEVIHAESNAISKLARGNESGLGATMFVTHQPCIDCAKLIYQSGIATVYYKNAYRSTQGLDFLNKSGVEVIHHHTLEELP